MLGLLLALVPAKLVSVSLIANQDAVAAAISRSAGASVRFQPGGRRWTLTVEVKNRPLDDVLHHLAYATFCSVRAEGSGFVLVENKQEEQATLAEYHRHVIGMMESQESDRYRQFVTTPFTLSAAKSYAEAARAAKNKQEYDRDIADAMPRPATRALAVLLHQIPVQKLIRQGHELVVFSDQPKPGELKLDPGAVSAALREYAEDRKIAQAFYEPSPIRLLLAIRNTDSMNYPSAELLMLDEDEQAGDSAKLPLLPNPRYLPPKGLLDSIPDSDPGSFNPIDEKIQRGSLSASEVSLLSHPMRYDPQNVIQGEVWTQLAKRTGHSLIMSLSDGYIGMFPTMFTTDDGPVNLKKCIVD